MEQIVRAEVWRHPTRPSAFEWRLLTLDEEKEDLHVVAQSPRQWGNLKDAWKDLERELASRGLELEIANMTDARDPDSARRDRTHRE